MKRLLFSLFAVALVATVSQDAAAKKAGEQERGTPQLAASQQDVATVAFAQQDSATLAATETAVYVDTGALTDQIQVSAAKNANLTPTAPSQPDHPVIGGELAKGEQASVAEVFVITNYGARLAPGDEGMSARFSNERTIKKT